MALGAVCLVERSARMCTVAHEIERSAISHRCLRLGVLGSIAAFSVCFVCVVFALFLCCGGTEIFVLVYRIPTNGGQSFIIRLAPKKCVCVCVCVCVFVCIVY